MKRDHLVRLGQLYQDVVHNTLFFEILNHLHDGFAVVLASVAGFVEQHGTMITLLLAIVVSLLKAMALDDRSPANSAGERKQQKRIGQKRDKGGRFAKTSRKER